MATPLDAPRTDGQQQKVDEMRQIVERLTKEKGVTLQALADGCAYSRSALSVFLKGQYPSYQLAVALENYFIKTGVVERPAAPTDIEPAADFLAIDDAVAVLGVCDLAATERELAVVVGPAGSGKTTALKEYARVKGPQAAYLRVDPSMSAAELLRELGMAIGLEFSTGISLRSIVRTIVERLRTAPRVILIDEADYLISGSVRKVEILRSIYDEAGCCGMVLCGMPRLKGLLTRGPSLKENPAQLYSRVAYMRELQGLTEDDFGLVCQRYQLSTAARRLLLTIAGDVNAGGMRRLVKILRKAAELTRRDGKDEITRDHVREADGLGLAPPMV